MTKQNNKHFVATGHLGYHKVFHPSAVCKYFEHCNIARISGRDCADYKNCRIYNHYEKYGLENLTDDIL